MSEEVEDRGREIIAVLLQVLHKAQFPGLNIEGAEQLTNIKRVAMSYLAENSEVAPEDGVEDEEEEDGDDS